MEVSEWLPAGAAGRLLSLILRLCRAVSCIASAIEEFRHLVGSPWITMTRGSSSKKKRREDLERQRRLAAAIDIEGESRAMVWMKDVWSRDRAFDGGAKCPMDKNDVCGRKMNLQSAPPCR